MLNEKVSKIAFVVILLFSIHFWDLRFPQKYNAENLITWLVCLYCFIVVVGRENMRYRNAIILFIVGLLFNTIAALINYGQSPYDTILSYEFYLFILLYFVLHFLNLKRNFLENVIIIFAILYSIIYVTQTVVYPFVILNNGLRFDKGEFQLAILGHGFLMLAYFLMLNRFMLDRKLMSLFIALGFLVILFMSNYRTLIAGGLLLTILFFIRNFKFTAKDFITLFFVFLLFVGFFQLKSTKATIEQTITYTKNNIKEGKNYVRMIDMEFYFKHYPENFSYFIIGGGKPSGDNINSYRTDTLAQNYNIVWVDIGLFGFYIIVGAIATFGMLWYTIDAVFIKLPNDRRYLNYYFLYLLVVSWANEEIYRDGIFAVHAVALYLIDNAINQKSIHEKEPVVKGSLSQVHRLTKNFDKS